MRGILRTGRLVAVIGCIAAGSAIALHADVKSQQKGQVKFAGALGKMFNMFGGKAAKEGVVTTVAVKGDRMLTRSGDTGQLVDLTEEKVYDISFNNSSYKVTTFDELRRRMREAEEKARQEQAKAEQREAKNAEKGGEKPPEYEFDVTTKSTGAAKAINGFDTKQAITTITVRQKGKTLEQGGGMVLTADSWLAPKMDSMKEIADFHVRYMKKLESPMTGAMSAEQMAAAFAMYPMLKEAMGKVRTEGEKVEGTPILTTMTFDSVANPEQAKAQADTKQEQKQEDSPSSVGGLGGMFAKKMMKKKAEEPAASTASNTPPGHTNVMTMVSETLSVSKDVAATDVAVPAGFKEKK